jgi:hypothetical protein
MGWSQWFSIVGLVAGMAGLILALMALQKKR